MELQDVDSGGEFAVGEDTALRATESAAAPPPRAAAFAASRQAKLRLSDAEAERRERDRENARLGLGRIAALFYCSSASHHIH
jgi:hypothetical protein